MVTITTQKQQGETSTLLLKFQRPFRGKKSSPLPTFSCSKMRKVIGELMTLYFQSHWNQMTNQMKTKTSLREILLELAKRGLQLGQS